MQKIATRVFIYASIAFGVFGIFMVLTSPQAGESGGAMNLIVEKLLLATVFIILPSFALSVAGKYLNDKF
jgi:hypothetical protein